MVHWYGLSILGVNQVKGHGFVEAVVGSVALATLNMWKVIRSDITPPSWTIYASYHTTGYLDVVSAIGFLGISWVF